MKPTNKTEVEWFIHGVLSTAVIDRPDDEFSVMVVEFEHYYGVFFYKHYFKLVSSGVGNEQVPELDYRDEEMFKWLKSESPEKLRNYTEDMVNWLND